MKRFFVIFAIFALLGCDLTQAQQTTKVIRGLVTDTKGNPVAGAEVRSTGGAEISYSGSDGTYEMEVPFYLKSVTVNSPGYNECQTMLDGKQFYVTKLKPMRGKRALQLREQHQEEQEKN